MSSSTDTLSSIDEVLEEAVASGAVPNAVAIAADRDGIVYEGAAGSRVAGERIRSPWTRISASCR